MSGAAHPTHAGGVVFRIATNRLEILIVTARHRPDEWVFPKGHIEAGESAEDAAVREVHEESGVRAAIIGPIEDVQIHPAGGRQTIRYFLMKAVENGSPGEGRDSLWLAADEALRRLTFEESRQSLERALDMMRTRGLM